MSDRDDLNVPMIASVGAVSVILTVAVVYAVQALYFNYANSELQRKVVLAPTTDSDSRLAEQEASLVRYGWVSRDAGTVTIPIDRAMSLVVAEYRDRAANGNATGTDDEGFP